MLFVVHGTIADKNVNLITFLFNVIQCKHLIYQGTCYRSMTAVSNINEHLSVNISISNPNRIDRYRIDTVLGFTIKNVSHNHSVIVEMSFTIIEKSQRKTLYNLNIIITPYFDKYILLSYSY